MSQALVTILVDALCALTVRDAAASQELVHNAVQELPTHAGLRFLYGSLLMDAGNNEQAIENLRHAYALDPANPLIGIQLGLSYFDAGKIQEALQIWQAADQESASTDVRAYLSGLVALAKGDIQDAKLQIESGLSIGSANQALAVNMRTLCAKIDHMLQADGPDDADTGHILLGQYSRNGGEM
ncbi:hypothetical protein WJ32_18585 (plasmid) [Burkholderia ubonensis]|uniref:Uncharacterized protein n=1 Tax=Burkholderia ubonensis TaxID=101571 RepID=A0A118HVK9_9BURK|nr:tetratricopeptide repeat protein [Burkholderia ubonensis]AOJ64587.1 hypothetical protein WJ32_18585 [Burkholderia ubonensis]KVG71131.1 hypothetical protein WJ33_21305 [Burkholderia ubonensis]